MLGYFVLFGCAGLLVYLATNSSNTEVNPQVEKLKVENKTLKDELTALKLEVSVSAELDDEASLINQTEIFDLATDSLDVLLHSRAILTKQQKADLIEKLNRIVELTATETAV